MNSKWLQHAILRAASHLAPNDQRSEWLEEWRSELWYIPRSQATPFCLGAFRDALWLRRNNLNPVDRTGIHLESPLSCLAFLSVLATLSIWIAARLVNMLPFPEPPGATATSGFDGILLFYLLLAGIGLAIGLRSGNPNTLRSWVFLTLKTMLVLPILHATLLAVIVIHVPFLPLGFFAAYVLLLRWVLTDQRSRCPVCLRLLTEPVRIGTPSQTFLEWYGAESMCSRGHGLLHTSEASAGFSAKPQWRFLDESWSGLFSASRGRHS